ncbi:MAG: abortive infection family protein [Planctomycetota bacterium]
MKPWSPRLLQALEDVITGGPGGSDEPSVGHYRSAGKLHRFFRSLDIDFQVGGQSRCAAVFDLLRGLNSNPKEHKRLVAVLEAAVLPADYADPAMLERVLKHLESALAAEGFALRRIGPDYRLQPRAGSVAAANELAVVAARLSLASVEADFARATQRADNEPEGAITAACSLVESVCKPILDEMAKPLPNKKDIKALVQDVASHLRLSPARTDLPAEWEADIKQILTGLVSVAGGIGALRTHAGDAHGRGRKPVAVDSRIARFAIHAASTLSVFLLDTWQQRSPAPPTASAVGRSRGGGSNEAPA